MRLIAGPILIAVVLCVAATHGQAPPVPAPPPPWARPLAGEPRAVASIERMMARLGGRAVWARAQTLFLEYDGWRTSPNEPVIERAWRNLRAPFMRSEYEGRSFLTESALSPTESWTSRDGVVTVAPAENHAAVLDRYPFGFYTSLHAFAIGDARIRLEWREPNQVVVRSVADERERGWWIIDDTGAVIKWGAPRPDGGTVEYVYGPIRPFGNVSFPAWGASLDGFWRWDYVTVDVTTELFSASVARPLNSRKGIQ